MLKGKAFIATPTYRGEVVWQYAHSLCRDAMLAAQSGWFVDAPWCVNDTLIQFARNKALSAFLANEHDYLVFIDADLGWEPGGLLKLLETEGDIVGGLYRSKGDDVHYPFNMLDGQPLPVGAISGPVANVPTGFMKISRKAAHRVLADYPEPFEFEKDERGTWGEDLTFCNRARRCGLNVIARTDIEFSHIGPYVWKGRFVDDVKT